MIGDFYVKSKAAQKISIIIVKNTTTSGRTCRGTFSILVLPPVLIIRNC